MTKTLFRLPLVLLSITLAACGDDGGGTGGGGGAGSGAGGGSTSTGTDTTEGFLEATVDGSPTGKAALSVTELPGAYAEKRDTSDGDERISVHANVPGTSPDFMVGEQSLRIYLEPWDGPREYVLGPADGAGAAYAEDDDTHVFYAQYGEEYETHGAGSITITERTDDRLKGSFAFTADDDAQAASVTIEGTFDLPLVDDVN